VKTTALLDLPPVTYADLQRAFARLRLPADWTFERAMDDALHSRVVRAYASTLRTRDWLATQRRTVVPVRRCQVGLDGHPMRWCTQLVAGVFEPRRQGELLKINGSDSI